MKCGLILVLITLFPTLFTQTPASQILSVPPSAFPELPANLVQELQRRGCTIPQGQVVNGRTNVIQAEFAKAGQKDWAVLCAARDVSTILVFWNGSEKNPASIAARPHSDYLQSFKDRPILLRELTAVDRNYIVKHFQAYGGPTPPPIDHYGIDDSFLEKASVIWYFYKGKWLMLTGAD
jgi:hypothetical protein